MRNMPLLVLVSVLGTLLAGCPGGASVSFTGRYSATVDMQEASFRGTLTITVMLTQTELDISGRYEAPGNTGGTGESATIAAMVTGMGGYGTAAAMGTLTPTVPAGLPAISISLFLTTRGDLILKLPEAEFLLERQE